MFPTFAIRSIPTRSGSEKKISGSTVNIGSPRPSLASGRIRCRNQNSSSPSITIAKANQLEIQEQSFGEILSTPNYQAVTVRLKLSGALQNVIKWLVQIQQPELFQAITSFSLKSANDPPTVSLELEIARWYAPKT